MKCQSPLTVVFAFSAKMKALSSPVPKKRREGSEAEGREMERRQRKVK